jgi:3-oxoacyl-[acyl-carrier-protein] synthase III
VSAIRAAAGAAVHSRILGVGGYRPRRVVGNREVCEVLDSTEEWIETRSGIRERRFAGPDETLPVMAAAAADKALAQAGTPAADVDLVLVASMSNLTQTPPLAVRVAHAIGARQAAALDVSAACAGFCQALAIPPTAAPRSCSPTARAPRWSAPAPLPASARSYAAPTAPTRTPCG